MFRVLADDACWCCSCSAFCLLLSSASSLARSRLSLVSSSSASYSFFSPFPSQKTKTFRDGWLTEPQIAPDQSHAISKLMYATLIPLLDSFCAGIVSGMLVRVQEDTRMLVICSLLQDFGKVKTMQML